MKVYVSLNPDYIEDIRPAASKMHGYECRSYMAEMTVKYCKGSIRRAETVSGWSRKAAETGLGEKRTGIICIGAQSVRSGRTLWEKKNLRLLKSCVRLPKSIRSRIRLSEAPLRIHG